jgi:hypothetical protein
VRKSKRTEVERYTRGVSARSNRLKVHLERQGISKKKCEVNLTMGKSRPQESELNQEKFWDERDRRAKYNAVSDACWLYQDRELEQNLRKLNWRKARKRVLGRGAVGREWMGRGRGELRLGRRGLEMRFTSGTRVMGWKELQDFVRARRS